MISHLIHLCAIALVFHQTAKAQKLQEEVLPASWDFENDNNLPNFDLDFLDSSNDVPIDQQVSPNISTLQYIIVMTRHGSRSPSYTYPNDPYPFTNRTFWPDGPMGLTMFGKQQLFSTGKILRRRYGNFLNKDYRKDDNKILTNKFDRDFMSAACLLAGLYPPNGYQIWNKNILWQPIPIWEDPFDVAYFFENSTFCPKFNLEMTKAIQDLNKNSPKYKKLFKYLSNNMGTKIENISDMSSVWDVLHMQKQNGFKLPSWSKTVYPDLLSPLHALAFKTAVTGSPKMVRLAAGPIMKMINENLMNKATGKTNPEERLFVDAGHDATLQALMSALGFSNPFPIDTSAFMIFELHKSHSSDFTVKFFYYNSSAHFVPNALDAPNCPYPCSLKTFNNLVMSLSPADWDAECKITSFDGVKNDGVEVDTSILPRFNQFFKYKY